MLSPTKSDPNSSHEKIGEVPGKSEHRILGMIFISQIKFKTTNNFMTAKPKAKLGDLRLFSNKISAQRRGSLVQAFVLSLLEYHLLTA
jgi:hypothetical protein